MVRAKLGFYKKFKYNNILIKILLFSIYIMESIIPEQANASQPISLIKRFGNMKKDWTIDTMTDSERLKGARTQKFGPGYKKMLETLFGEWQKETNVNIKKLLASQITALIFVLYYKTRLRMNMKPGFNMEVQSALIGPGESSKYFLTVWYDKKGKCNFIIPDTYWDKIYVDVSTIEIQTFIDASQLMPSTKLLYDTDCLDLKKDRFGFQFYEFPDTLDIAGLNILRVNSNNSPRQDLGNNIKDQFESYFSQLFWENPFYETCIKSNNELSKEKKMSIKLYGKDVIGYAPSDDYSNKEDFVNCVKAERGTKCKGVFGSLTTSVFGPKKGGKTQKKNRKRAKKRRTNKAKSRRYKK